ncbi:ATP-binding cassette domain-containing protein [Paenibacillus aestuarii]|uniref:ATP-binding cassette domain-containing protein n=1 Tax=Paenibacillus aestuarii TaxID=516965 RepID=A0ABW0K1C8_9BACL|nr:ATP-binding cassette domain-containing protein [Paenibacillus aestuarii]
MTIALRDIRVHAPEDRQIELLKGIDLELQQDTVTLLIGHTGSGKSTLLQVLAGIQKPSAGEITLDGEPLWQKGKVDHAKLLRLGLTFQFPEQQLFAGSIEREFAYSLRPYRLKQAERERRIRAACQELDPRGVFAMERSPFALSGGEQRRLALATTLATAPDWLFMDEPTAGLEAAAAGELLRLIRGRERGGFVIATHDLDTFFPLADRVLVMDGGAIVADGTPAELCRAPERLERAGVGLPSSVRVAQSLARAGIAVAPDRLTPALAAEAIAEALRAPAGASEPDAAAPLPVAQPGGAVRAVAPVPAAPDRPAWLRLDPRAKWLLYLLLGIGTMLQTSWYGLAAAAVPVALACIGLPRETLRGLWKIGRPFLIFMAVTVALAGLDIQGAAGASLSLGFSLDRAISTLLNVTRLFIVVIAGYWLASTTPYGQLSQGLSWALSFFQKWRLPVDAFALAVSLIFRFIPLILREWQRFSTIVRARGKAALHPGKVRMRDIPAMVVPLLLSMFHKAEELTVALELKRADGLPFAKHSHLLAWKKADTWLVAGGCICFVILVLIR